MEEQQKFKRILIRGAVIVGAWTAVAFVFTVTQSLNAGLSDYAKSFSLRDSFILQIVSCFGWMMLTPLILKGAKTFLPIERVLYRNLFFLFLLGILVILLQATYQAVTLPHLGYPKNRIFSTFSEAFTFMLAKNSLISASLYLVTLGIILTGIFYEMFRVKELKNSELKANLTQARLQVLKMQLHPHFLFNTHNAISELIHKDPNRAEKILTNLSDLLRISFEKLDDEEIPLQQELEFIAKYIEIEQTRFQERLQVEMKIAGNTLDAIVPNMILQPLVENAINHGIAPLVEGGKVKIVASSKAGFLHLQVIDNGAGVKAEELERLDDGVGLANTKARLKHLFNDKQSFEINSQENEGFTVSITIPFTTQSPDSDD